MKLNIEETVAAQTYAAYTIASSYFGPCTCASRQMEQRSRVIFCALSAKEQEKMEERIIFLMEKKVLPKIRKGFLNSRVKVKFLADGRGILATDGKEALIIRLTWRSRELKDPATGVEYEKFNIRIGAWIWKIGQIPRR